jgi:hypothetical protein
MNKMERRDDVNSLTKSDAMRIFFTGEMMLWLSTGIWDGGKRGYY